MEGIKRSWWGTPIHRVLAVLLCIYLVLPFVWMVVYGIYPPQNLRTVPMDLNPAAITFDNYRSLLMDQAFLTSMLNSLIVGAATTALCMLLGSLCACVLARFHFRGSQGLLLAMMTVQAVPVIVLAVPLFVSLRGMGLFDTRIGLILAYAAFILPLVIWMMVSFFNPIPVNLEKAARVDGCSRIGIFRRVVLPLSGSRFTATAIFAFVTAWSDFFFAKVLIGTETSVLPVTTASFQGLFAMDYTRAATAEVIAALPVLLLALLAWEWIIQRITEGAVKG